tara:strand:+ start:143 stop:454 length:312 start_codon:yes stop_codon:yes gene_type:complete
MKRRPRNKKLNNLSGLFYFTASVIVVSLGFVFHITLRNECLESQRELVELSKIKQEYDNKIKFLDSKVRDLTSHRRIEKVARERFGMVSPEPESLIVVVWDKR